MTEDKNITALNEVLRLLRIAQDFPAKKIAKRIKILILLEKTGAREDK